MSLLYPISLNLEDKFCVVVGGGNVAYRKIQRLLDCGARIKVISPRVVPQLEHDLKGSASLTWVATAYTGREDLKGACLVFAATNDPIVNEQIRLEANALGILVNVASQSHLGDFIVPATFSKGDLQVSVSTGGKVPGLSKLIKETLEGEFIPEYGDLIDILEQVRQVAVTETISKKENLIQLGNIVSNYDSILEDLRSGVPVDTITQRLMNILK